jgi:hypothetical protein
MRTTCRTQISGQFSVHLLDLFDQKGMEIPASRKLPTIVKRTLHIYIKKNSGKVSQRYRSSSYLFLTSCLPVYQTFSSIFYFIDKISGYKIFSAEKIFTIFLVLRNAGRPPARAAWPSIPLPVKINNYVLYYSIKPQYS